MGMVVLTGYGDHAFTVVGNLATMPTLKISGGIAGLLCAVSLLGGCWNTPVPKVPVISKALNVPVTKGTHVVKKGESLYAIAWKYHRDFKDLAENNGIQAPYRIYPGQKLKLAQRNVTQRNARAQNESKLKMAKRVDLNAPLSPSKANGQSSPSFNRSPPPNTIWPKTAASRPSNQKWGWPVKGQRQLKAKITRKKNNGIDIAGHLGEAVLAAKNGRVVYQGNGLRGYGNLIIIKHDDTYISAYAYNQQILVAEGDEVKKGQRIGLMGGPDHQQGLLHFQIRKKGKAIDPLPFFNRG